MPQRKKWYALVGLLAILGIPPVVLMCGAATLRSPNFSRQVTARLKGAEYLGSEGVVFQAGRMNCGPTALKMVLDAFGIPSTLAEIEQKAGLTDRGTSMLTLKMVAESKGLRAEGWKYALEDFKAAPMPAIVFTHGNHFAVVDSLSKDGSVFLRDPAIGRLKMAKRKFLKVWNGETLIFRREP